MRSHIGWRGERNIPYKGVETSPLRESSKGTISASSGLELLQMVSELVWCASEDAGPPSGWIVRSHIGWRGEQSIPCKGVETSS